MQSVNSVRAVLVVALMLVVGGECADVNASGTTFVPMQDMHTNTVSAYHVGIVLLVVCCRLSTSGTWRARSDGVDKEHFGFYENTQPPSLKHATTALVIPTVRATLARWVGKHSGVSAYVTVVASIVFTSCECTSTARVCVYVTLVSLCARTLLMVSPSMRICTVRGSGGEIVCVAFPDTQADICIVTSVEYMHTVTETGTFYLETASDAVAVATHYGYMHYAIENPVTKERTYATSYACVIPTQPEPLFRTNCAQDGVHSADVKWMGPIRLCV